VGGKADEKVQIYANLSTYIVSKDCCQQVIGKTNLFEGDYPHHATVYIPTADLGQT